MDIPISHIIKHIIGWPILNLAITGLILLIAITGTICSILSSKHFW